MFSAVFVSHFVHLPGKTGCFDEPVYSFVVVQLARELSFSSPLIACVSAQLAVVSAIWGDKNSEITSACEKVKRNTSLEHFEWRHRVRCFSALVYFLFAVLNRTDLSTASLFAPSPPPLREQKGLFAARRRSAEDLLRANSNCVCIHETCCFLPNFFELSLMKLWTQCKQ